MRISKLLTIASLAATWGLLAGACKKTETTQPATGGLPPITAPTGATAGTKDPGAAVHAPSTGGQAAATAAAAMAGAPTGASMKGKVLEKIDAGPYSYLRLQGTAGETWAAVPVTKTAVGAEVTVLAPMPMDGFESKTLKRKFDHLVFGTLAGEPAAKDAPAGGAAEADKLAAAHGTTAAPASAAAPGPGGHPSAPAAAVGDIKVPKADGPEGKTVAEVWSKKAALKDKVVVVRGKVVKYNAGVLGKNWIHVRDGSGSEASADNDLTATTNDTAAVGDVVVLKGTVHLDKDFGAGYKYPVIVEDAKLQK